MLTICLLSLVGSLYFFITKITLGCRGTSASWLWLAVAFGLPRRLMRYVYAGHSKRQERQSCYWAKYVCSVKKPTSGGELCYEISSIHSSLCCAISPSNSRASIHRRPNGIPSSLLTGGYIFEWELYVRP